MNRIFNAKFLVEQTRDGEAPVEVIYTADDELEIQVSPADRRYSIRPPTIPARAHGVRAHAVLQIEGPPGPCVVHFVLDASTDADVVRVP